MPLARKDGAFQPCFFIAVCAIIILKSKNNSKAMRSKIISAFILSVVFLSSAAPALSADNPIEFRFLGVSVQERAERAIEFMLSIAGSLALLAIIFSGIFYMIANGNPNSQTKAKKMLIGSLTGLVLVLLSYSFIYYVDYFATK